MTLEEYIAPFIWLDEKIKKHITKIAVKSGFDRKKEAYALNVIIEQVNFNINVLPYIISPKYNSNPTTYLSNIALFLSTETPAQIITAKNLFSRRTDQEYNEAKIEQDPMYKKIVNYAKLIRLPQALAGTTLLIYSGANIYRNLEHGEPLDLNITENIQLGIRFCMDSLASYINDIDRNLLNKKPIEKRTLSWLNPYPSLK